ncbi:hypothetical protein GN956_G24511 [Arapaima gigas]
MVPVRREPSSKRTAEGSSPLEQTAGGSNPLSDRRVSRASPSVACLRAPHSASLSGSRRLPRAGARELENILHDHVHLGKLTLRQCCHYSSSERTEKTSLSLREGLRYLNLQGSHCIVSPP